MHTKRRRKRRSGRTDTHTVRRVGWGGVGDTHNSFILRYLFSKSPSSILLVDSVAPTKRRQKMKRTTKLISMLWERRRLRLWESALHGCRACASARASTSYAFFSRAYALACPLLLDGLSNLVLLSPSPTWSGPPGLCWFQPASSIVQSISSNEKKERERKAQARANLAMDFISPPAQTICG